MTSLNNRSLMLLLIVFFHTLSLSGQLHFRNLEIDKGLSLVKAIYRDNKGFLWIGNDGLGLERLDGYTAEIYHHKPTDTNSISSDFILCILETSKKKLWVGTREGLNLYIPEHNHFKQYLKDDKHGLKNDDIHDIFEDNKHQLWVCTGKGLYRYNEPKDQFDVFYISDKTGENNFSSIRQDSKGNYWVLTSSNGLYRFYPETKKFKHYADNKKSAKTSWQKTLLIDKKDNFWLGLYQEGFVNFNRETGVFKHYPVNGGGVGTMGELVLATFEESDSTILITVDQGGINRFNKNTGKFSYINSSNSHKNGLTTNGVFCFHKDKKGILWVGTSRGGVYYYNPKLELFTIYKANTLKKETSDNTQLTYSVIGCFFEYDENHIWFGTDGGGINILDKRNGQFNYLRHNPKDEKSLNSDVIRSITMDKDSTIWVATWNNKYLNKYNSKQNNFEQFFFEKQADIFNKTPIWYFKIDHKNRFWFAFITGYVLILDKNGNKIADFEPVIKDRTNSPTYIFANKSQEYFISCLDAVYKFNDNEKLFEKFADIENSLSLIQDREGNYWIGNNRNGIYLCNRQGEIIKQITQKDGLSDNSALSILESKNGDKWIATNYGLSRYIASEHKFINYYKSDGLQGNQFFYQSFLQTRDGELYFGGINGACSFNPSDFEQDSSSLPVYFKDLYVQDKRINYNEKNTYLEKHLNETDEIILNHDFSVFSIEFTSPNFTFHEQIRYAYKLNGFDDDWIYKDAKNRRATYTNLDPGEYVFCVAALAPGMESITNYRQIKITIPPPWWATTWFRILMIVFILGSSILFYSIRVNKLRKQQKILEQTVKERTHELQDANNELMTKQEEIEKRNTQLKENEDHLIELNSKLSTQKEELESTLENLKKTQSQLVQSEKMASLGVLTSGVAHEINNPLNYIMGAYVALKKYFKVEGSKDVKKTTILLKGIQEGITRISNIVKGLNLFNRNNKSGIEPYNIHSIIDNCLLMLRSQIKGKVKIEQKYATDSIMVHCDVGKLHQAFINILSNAMQAIEKEGAIVISTKKEKEKVTIEIKDTGHGISKENLPRITDPFFTTKEAGEGTGLGLSMTFTIIQEHHGEINFDSEIGIGTTVLVTLPLTKEEQ